MHRWKKNQEDVNILDIKINKVEETEVKLVINDDWVCFFRQKIYGVDEEKIVF